MTLLCKTQFTPWRFAGSEARKPNQPRPSPSPHFASPHLSPGSLPRHKTTRPQTTNGNVLHGEESNGQQENSTPPTHLHTTTPYTGLVSSQRTPSPSHRRSLAPAPSSPRTPRAGRATTKKSEMIAQPLSRPSRKPERRPAGPCARSLRSLARFCPEARTKRSQTKDPD